jgi:hypothetical protein
MNLTKELLKTAIEEVLIDMELMLPYPLKAEPGMTSTLNEGVEDKIVGLLQKISSQDRDSIFKRFGYEKRSKISKSISKNILQNISDIKRAEKGDL